MISILDLSLASESKEKLDQYLLSNIEDIARLSELSYDELCGLRFEIDDFIVEFDSVIDQLNYHKYYNSLFVLTFLSYAEKVILPGSYRQLYRIATNKSLKIGKRHHAAKIFLLDIKVKNDHIISFEPIVRLLQEAYETEEDNEIAVVSTFANYFTNAINNTAEVDITIIQTIIQKTIQAREKNSFLNVDLVDRIISIIPRNDKEYIVQVKHAIQEYVFAVDIEDIASDEFVIESDSAYAAELTMTEANFESIRKISRTKYNTYTNTERDIVWSELRRGVKIIDDEKQLFAYMTLYGKKHHIKLRSAFNFLKNLPGSFNIIDWGCGQGLASMVFMDTFGTESIQKIILNEPSALALKRAGLHLSKYYDRRKISTVNKTIGNLNSQDINPNNQYPTIHLFSNILDIDLDITHLISIIKSAVVTENYFICVSPYINDYKTSKIDMFTDLLLNAYSNNFEIIQAQDIKQTDPTMVLRMFKVSAE